MSDEKNPYIDSAVSHVDRRRDLGRYRRHRAERKPPAIETLGEQERKSV